MGNEFKYRYTPLAEVLQRQDPRVVAEAVRRCGCYELDSTEHLVKLDEAGERKVLAMLGELNLINLRQLKERESCATYEEYAELSQSPVVDLCESLEFHPLLEDFHAWRYGWPIGQLPDFSLSNEDDAPQSTGNAASAKVVAGDTAAESSNCQQEANEPRMKNGKNTRDATEKWVSWQARSIVKPNETVSSLAERIRLLAEKWGYESERRKMTGASITTMIPAGLTGGRRKNKGAKKTRAK